MKAPIAIMSFNRPDFLAPVMQSLKEQRGDALAGREIHLFQDGACNRYSRMRYAQDADIEASIACFRQAFPEGVVHHPGDNIGIAENFAAAEEYFFVERGVECAYFFEDDMVLSPSYLAMMEILQGLCEKSGRVAYFAAYGDYYASRDEIAERRREVITLDHHWAFGLLRRHWLGIHEALADYRRLVFGQDYARRDHRAIYDYYEQFGAAPRGSSQDAAKAFACDRLGLWRCRTFAPFAKYIGTKGAHMTEAHYESLGFSKTVVIRDPVANLRFPGERELADFLREQHTLFLDIHRTELPELRQTLPARKYNPMRRCTAQDVLDGYRLFLLRDPESEAILLQHVGRRSVHEFVQGLTSSPEFEAIRTGASPAKRPLDPARLCTRDDVVNGYRLMMHRDPDGEAVIARYQDKVSVLDFCKSMLASGEFSEIAGRIVI
jgi:hypothetical protein